MLAIVISSGFNPTACPGKRTENPSKLPKPILLG